MVVSFFDAQDTVCSEAHSLSSWHICDQSYQGCSHNWDFRAFLLHVFGLPSLLRMAYRSAFVKVCDCKKNFSFLHQGHFAQGLQQFMHNLHFLSRNLDEEFGRLGEDVVNRVSSEECTYNSHTVTKSGVNVCKYEGP